MLIILWMSYFLRPHLISLLTAAKTVYQQKKGQNLTSLTSKFTKGHAAHVHIQQLKACFVVVLKALTVLLVNHVHRVLHLRHILCGASRERLLHHRLFCTGFTSKSGLQGRLSFCFLARECLTGDASYQAVMVCSRKYRKDSIRMDNKKNTVRNIGPYITTIL